MTVNRSDGPHLNWEAIAKFTDLREVLDAIPPEEIIERLGVDVAIRTIGAERILATPEAQKLVEVWETRLTTEQLEEMLRKRRQG